MFGQIRLPTLGVPPGTSCVGVSTGRYRRFMVDDGFIHAPKTDGCQEAAVVGGVLYLRLRRTSTPGGTWMARWRYVFCTRLYVAFAVMILSCRTSLSNDTMGMPSRHISRKPLPGAQLLKKLVSLASKGYCGRRSDTNLKSRLVGGFVFCGETLIHLPPRASRMLTSVCEGATTSLSRMGQPDHAVNRPPPAAGCHQRPKRLLAILVVGS